VARVPELTAPLSRWPFASPPAIRMRLTSSNYT